MYLPDQRGVDLPHWAIGFLVEALRFREEVLHACITRHIRCFNIVHLIWYKCSHHSAMTLHLQIEIHDVVCQKDCKTDLNSCVSSLYFSEYWIAGMTDVLLCYSRPRLTKSETSVLQGSGKFKICDERMYCTEVLYVVRCWDGHHGVICWSEGKRTLSRQCGRISAFLFSAQNVMRDA